MKVICLSLITNKVIISGDEGEAASHEEVLQAVSARTVQVQSLVQKIVESLGKDGGILQNMPDLPPVSLNVPDMNGKMDLSKFSAKAMISLSLVTFSLLFGRHLLKD